MNSLNLRINWEEKTINPFPQVSFNKFSLGEEWYLPQHLPILKELTGLQDLKWDLKGKEEFYSEIFQREWIGNLGLFFYQKPNKYDSRLLPPNWFIHKFKGNISKEEMNEWDIALQRYWELNYKKYKKI